MTFDSSLPEDRWTKLCLDLLKMKPRELNMFRESNEIYKNSPRKEVLAKIREK
jgi:hypothetical protein